jgi:adenosyl cobinamide kinase/adenosyl cobinamide phosphate guanylyltransferase
MSETKSNAKGCLNFEGVGKIVAVIKDDTDNKKEKKKNNPHQSLYVCDNKQAKELRHPETEVQLSDGYRFQLAINKETERQIGYICGASGSGKSYFAKQFILEYHKAYSGRPIYIISALTEDTTLDSLKCIKRIKLSPEFLADELKSSDFADSLVILDDTDTISNKKMRNKVNQIRDDILSTGRHYNVSCLVTTHTPCAGLETKLILNESHFITIFPAGLGGRAKAYLLETYLGLDKLQIKKLKDIDSRSITFIKGFPQVVLAERNAYILTDIDK